MKKPRITRKQALLHAIEIIKNNSTTDDNSKELEMINVLEEMIKELPFSYWTQASIVDAFNQYILEHGCLPLMTEIDNHKQLPKHSTIKQNFKMTTRCFFELYYADYVGTYKTKIYGYKDREYWINCFKEQYIKLGCPGKVRYDKLRDEGIPCANQMLKLTKIGTWNELLDYCGFEIIGENRYSKKKKKKKIHNDVLVSKTFQEDKNYEKLEEIQEMINSLKKAQ